MFHRKPSLTLTLLLVIALGSPALAEKTLTVMSHDSFNISREVLAIFERENQVKVRFLKSGDAGAALVQAILAKDRPLADLFYGVDNTFLSRALAADIFASYPSPMLTRIPPGLRHADDDRLLPVNYGDVCLNYDREWFRRSQLAPPTDLADLVREEYRGLTVVQNPATSSPGLAFLLATIGRFGEEGFLRYWRELRANQVLVANGWKDAYYGHFTAASPGDRPIVVSYASSPPAAVHFASSPPAEAPTAAVVTDGNAFRQVEYVGILKGAGEPQLAEKFVDFMLSPAFQEDIPLQMFVFPANPEAQLPEVFQRHAVVARQPVVVSPADIEANRERWIEAWTSAVLR